MAEQGRTGLMLCCNDRNGNFTGTVSQIHIDDLELELEISLEPGDEGALPFEVRKPKERWQGKGGPYLRIGGFREITSYRYTTWVGNIFWNYAEVLPPEAAELFNFLRERGLIQCTQGPCEIFEKFERGEKITAHDLCECWVKD